MITIEEEHMPRNAGDPVLRHLTPAEADLRREYVAAQPGPTEIPSTSLCLPILDDWVAAGKPKPA
jgi:hypothetical protein